MVTVHVLVKNEARFIWYSIMSVINHVDRVRIRDTGSTDGTQQIIDEIRKDSRYKDKIIFHQENIEKFDEQLVRQGMLNHDAFSDIRQKMLDLTKADWFIVVDGDEIWWEESIKKVVEEINKNGDKLESIVVPTINLVGDIFHYQDKSAGRYRFGNRKGHYAIRAINRKIPGLHSQGGHGVWGWADSDNKMVQDRDPNKIKFIDAPYLHATHLERAGKLNLEKEVIKRSFKRKHEIGIPFPKDFYYPESFFFERPSGVPNIWKNMDFDFKLRSYLETPLRKLNRKIMKEKVGY